MHTKFLFLIPLVFMISSCKQEKTNKQSNNICKSFPDVFESANAAKQYISNGCDERSGEIPGEKSAVYIWTGSGTCTGTVISEHFILTAAHCFYNRDIEKEEPYINNAEIIYRNNVFDLNTTSSSVKVKKVIVNPLFKDNAYVVGNFLSMKNSFLGDIALVQTKDNLIQDHGLVAAKVAAGNANTSENVLSIGYGLTGQFDKNSIGLKRWSVAGVGKLNLDPVYHFFNPRYLIAFQTGYLDPLAAPNNPEDTFLITEKKAAMHGQICDGDSGGPQFVKRNGEPALISITTGITSLLVGPYNTNDDPNFDSCAYPSGVNTYAFVYKGWLNGVMANSDYPAERLQMVH